MKPVTGQTECSLEGITVTMDYKPAKTKKGKDTLRLFIRQNNGKKWKLSESLAFPRCVDIAFVLEP
jgi:hypothetical protein